MKNDKLITERLESKPQQLVELREPEDDLRVTITLIALTLLVIVVGIAIVRLFIERGWL